VSELGSSPGEVGGRTTPNQALHLTASSLRFALLPAAAEAQRSASELTVGTNHSQARARFLQSVYNPHPGRRPL
jgi:hypothetical protein